MNPYKERYKLLLGRMFPIHPDTKFGANVSLGEGVVIEEGCSIGSNSILSHHCILRPGTILGQNCVIGHLTVFEGDSVIGDRVLIHSQCHITRGVLIEDDVFIAPFFCGANTSRIVHGRNYCLDIKPYIIKRAARIAVGVIFLPGVIIGENSLIGAGSVVTHDVPDREIWFGNPATKHGNVPKDELL